MHRLNTPDVDDQRVYDAVCGAKKQPTKDLLIGARNQIFTAYVEYSELTPHFTGLSEVELNDLQKDALHHCYTSATKPFNELAAVLNQAISAVKCPYCSIGESSTLDHYLPREKFAQFSIYSLNLVPSCAACNTRKSDLVLDEAVSIRFFLHPYFDEIPEEPFLTLETKVLAEGLILKFNLERPATLAEIKFQHIHNHFTKLNLAERYRNMSLSHLREERKAFRRHFGKDQSSKRLAGELLKVAKEKEADYGSNYWQVVLYRSLAANTTFCGGGFEILEKLQTITA